MGNINMWLKLIKTSKICHSLNGNVFKFKDMIPELMLYRRSTTVPHVETGGINSLMSVKVSIRQRIK